MAHLLLGIFTNPTNGMYIFLSIGAVALFAVFLPIVTWIDKQHKEREAFYKAETIRRITEASGEGAKAAMELMREEVRLDQLKKREGMKIGGLICVAVGAAMVIFLRVVAASDADSPYLVGLIPAFVGLALLIYVYWMAAPLDSGRKD